MEIQSEAYSLVIIFRFVFDANLDVMKTIELMIATPVYVDGFINDALDRRGSEEKGLEFQK